MLKPDIGLEPTPVKEPLRTFDKTLFAVIPGDGPAGRVEFVKSLDFSLLYLTLKFVNFE